MRKYPTIPEAEEALEEASKTNPGRWVGHSRYAAQACRNIANLVPGMNPEKAYVVGLLHDIGRWPGKINEKHLINGYTYCMERGWDEIARICISHSFVLHDIGVTLGKMDVTPEEYQFMKHFVETEIWDNYDRLIQLCDNLALPDGFCLIESRIVDVTRRYGVNDLTVQRINAIYEIKEDFEKQMGCSIYDVLPGAAQHHL